MEHENARGAIIERMESGDITSTSEEYEALQYALSLFDRKDLNKPFEAESEYLYQKKIRELEVKVDRLEEKIALYQEEYVLKDISKDDRCERCGGRGEIAYANTSTYNHGIGGQMITGGVCDLCWGSGKKHTHWKSWKEINEMYKKDKQSQSRIQAIKDIDVEAEAECGCPSCHAVATSIKSKIDELVKDNGGGE